MKVFALDTETTGFGPCRLVELAYKDVDSPFGLFVQAKPPIPIEDQAAAVHGITNEMCADFPVFQEISAYGKIKEDLENNIVMAHSAVFDIGVLAREGIFVKHFIDTRKVAQRLYKHAPNHKLQTLREYLKLEVNGQAHSARGDVEVLEALYKQMRSDMELRSIAPETHIDLMIKSSLGA